MEPTLHALIAGVVLATDNGVCQNYPTSTCQAEGRQPVAPPAERWCLSCLAMGLIDVIKSLDVAPAPPETPVAETPETPTLTDPEAAELQAKYENGDL